MTEPTSSVSSFQATIKAFAARFGKHAPEVERFIKFVITGFLATAVDFAVANLLLATVFPPQGSAEQFNVLAATTLAYITGIIFSFLVNRLWIYPETAPLHPWKQFLQFFSVYILALGIRTLVISAVYPLWAEAAHSVLFADQPAAQLTANRIGTNLAQATAIGVTMLWNFFVNRYWTFGDVK